MDQDGFHIRTAKKVKLCGLPEVALAVVETNALPIKGFNSSFSGLVHRLAPVPIATLKAFAAACFPTCLTPSVPTSANKTAMRNRATFGSFTSMSLTVATPEADTAQPLVPCKLLPGDSEDTMTDLH